MDSYYNEYRIPAGPNMTATTGLKIKLIDNNDGTYSISAREPVNISKNIAGAATTLIKSGPGVLKKIVYNKPISSSIVTVFDSLTATGVKLATITNPLVLLEQQFSLDYDLSFVNGLTIVTSAADDITVVFL